MERTTIVTLVSSVVAAILAGGGGHLLKKLQERTIEERKADPRYQGLARRYEPWTQFAQRITIFGGFTAAVVWWMLLLFVAEAWFGTFKDVRFMFPGPSGIFWALIAMFLGLLSVGLVMTAVQAIKFRHEREALQEYGRRTAPWLPTWARGAANWFGALAASCFLLLLPLGLDWYALFAQDEIAVNRFASLGARHYAYDEITEIRIFAEWRPADCAEPRRFYLEVGFADGTYWTSRWSTAPPAEGSVRAAAAYLSRRTGLEVTEAESPLKAARTTPDFSRL